VAVGDGHISSNIGANPVSDVFVVKRINVSIVFSRAREVDRSVFDNRSRSKSKFRGFTSFLQGMPKGQSCVLEVEVSKNHICWGSRSLFCR